MLILGFVTSYNDVIAEIKKLPKRQVLLNVYSKFDEDHSKLDEANQMLSLADKMNDLLLITSNSANEEWFAFITGVQTSNDEIVSRGDQKLDKRIDPQTAQISRGLLSGC